MRLGISRHRRARRASAKTAARGLVAAAGGSVLVIALSGTAGAGVSGALGAAGTVRSRVTEVAELVRVFPAASVALTV